MFMGKSALNVALVSSCMVLAGCQTSPMPVASNFAYAEQYKLRSANHWNVVAKDAVEQTIRMLEGKGLAHGTSVYVEASENASTFEANFHEFLLTHLVRQGISVQVQPHAAALVLRYQTNSVVHKGDLPQSVAGRFTALGAGIWATYGLRDQHLDVLMAMPTALGLARDWLDSRTANGPTHSEIVVTTSALLGNKYIARYTDTYYIQDVDAALFGHQGAHDFEARTMKVVNQ
ncbi:hypothetical protein [Comamonas sp.]